MPETCTLISDTGTKCWADDDQEEARKVKIECQMCELLRLFNDRTNYLAGVAKKVLGVSYDDIADILQEAYRKAAEKISAGMFREEANMQTWVTRIIWTTALDKRRKNGRSPAAHEEFDIVDVSPDPHDMLVEAERAILVHHAIETLTGSERDITNLILEGFTHAEVASQLDIRPGTVASMWYRVRGKLRQVLSHDIC